MFTRLPAFGLAACLGLLSVAGGCATLVPNPDYQRWAAFGPGSSVTMEGYESISGQKHDVRITGKLISRTDRQLVLERTCEQLVDGRVTERQVNQQIELAQIVPEDHPLTHPAAHEEELPAEELTIAGRTRECQVVQLEVTAKFASFGENVRTTAYRCAQIPGGLARILFQASTDDGTFEFFGQVVDFTVVAE